MELRLRAFPLPASFEPQLFAGGHSFLQELDSSSRCRLGPPTVAEEASRNVHLRSLEVWRGYGVRRITAVTSCSDGL